MPIGLVARLRVLAAEQDSVHADRPVDVLDLLLAEIFVGHVQAIADLIADRRGDADASGLGDRFEARRYVDAVAENVALVHDHVAEIDADAIEQGT
jgi:hypothetical protein